MDRKKVFFVPGYFYLAAEQFAEIAQQLSDKYECSFVKVLAPSPEFNEVNARYDEEFFRKYSLELLTIEPFIHLGVISKPQPRSTPSENSTAYTKFSLSLIAKRILIKINKFFGGQPIPLHFPIRENTNIPIVINICEGYYKVKRSIHYFRNFLQMLFLLHSLDEKNPLAISIRKIEELKPDLVVVNSDLGHIGILHLLEACRLSRVQILILPTCDIENENVGLKHRFESFLSKRLFNTNLPKWAYMRATNFNSRVVGRFCLKSTILVPSDAIKSKLTDRGIDDTRIEVCHFPPPNMFAATDPNVIGSPAVKKIVFYTECLHEIFTEEKVVNAHIEIAAALSEIQRKYPVEVLVKPHPRELLHPHKLEKIIHKPFSEMGIRVRTDVPTDELISTAFLNIAHYSKVLITSCIMGRPITSLSLKNENSTNTFIVDSDSAIVSIQNNDRLVAHISELLENPEAYQRLIDATTAIGSRYNAPEDHLPVSEVIEKHILQNLPQD